MSLSKPPTMKEIVNFDTTDLTEFLKFDDYYQHEKSKEKIIPYLKKCDQNDDYAFYFFLHIIREERVFIISYYLFLYKKTQHIQEKVWIDIYYKLLTIPDILNKIEETHITTENDGKEVIFRFDAHEDYWACGVREPSVDCFVIQLKQPYRNISQLTFCTGY